MREGKSKLGGFAINVSYKSTCLQRGAGISLLEPYRWSINLNKNKFFYKIFRILRA